MFITLKIMLNLTVTNGFNSILDCEMPVSRSISLVLLLVLGRSSWLHVRSPTVRTFAAVLAERGRPLPFFRSVSPLSSICLIKLHKLGFLKFRAGYSRIIRSALHPLVILNVFIRILSSFLNGAMFTHIYKQKWRQKWRCCGYKEYLTTGLKLLTNL